MSSVLLPRPAALGIAFGLALMAFFTALWTAWAFSAARGWLIILAGAFWLAAV
jgi:hypothetical protein